MSMDGMRGSAQQSCKKSRVPGLGQNNYSNKKLILCSARAAIITSHRHSSAVSGSMVSALSFLRTKRVSESCFVRTKRGWHGAQDQACPFEDAVGIDGRDFHQKTELTALAKKGCHGGKSWRSHTCIIHHRLRRHGLAIGGLVVDA